MKNINGTYYNEETGNSIEISIKQIKGGTNHFINIQNHWYELQTYKGTVLFFENDFQIQLTDSGFNLFIDNGSNKIDGPIRYIKRN